MQIIWRQNKLRKTTILQLNLFHSINRDNRAALEWNRCWKWHTFKSHNTTWINEKKYIYVKIYTFNILKSWPDFSFSHYAHSINGGWWPGFQFRGPRPLFHGRGSVEGLAENFGLYPWQFGLVLHLFFDWFHCIFLLQCEKEETQELLIFQDSIFFYNTQGVHTEVWQLDSG